MGLVFLHDPADAPTAPGAYVLWLRLDAPLRVSAGDRPGLLYPGDYLYCGSARGPGGLRARLARHWRREKRPHWHVDQITLAGRPLAAWIDEGGDECALNAALGALPIPVPGFGSSDCPRCAAHLRRIEKAAPLPAAMREAVEFAPASNARLAFRLLRESGCDDDLSVDCWVRIMCDFTANGVWNRAGACVSLEDLPVDEALRDRIRRWQAVYDDHDDHDGPDLDVAPFSAEGLAIAQAVKRRLPDWTVVYHDEAKFRAYLNAERHSLEPRWRKREFEYEIVLPYEAASDE